MKAEYIEKLKLLKIMDDDFARLVFEDEASGIEVLRILQVLPPNVEVFHYETQKDIVNPSSRSLVFDIFVVTEDRVIDMEIENSKIRATPKRARLHSSEMDVHISQPKEDFVDLPINIVVFICSFDYYQKGLPYYTIERTVKELGIDFLDQSKIIYVNGKYVGTDEIGKLIHDLQCTNPKDMHNDVLRNRVTYFKERESGVKTVCKIWDDIKKEGKIEGKIEERINSICALMSNAKLSVNEAMAMLNVPEDEREEYRKLVEDKLLNDSKITQKEKCDE